MEAEELRAELACLEREEEECVRSLSPQNEWISALMRCQGEKAVTQKMMTEFIRCIKVYGYNEIEIIWNFQDEFIRLAEAVKSMAEVQAQGRGKITVEKIRRKSKDSTKTRRTRKPAKQKDRKKEDGLRKGNGVECDWKHCPLYAPVRRGFPFWGKL